MLDWIQDVEIEVVADVISSIVIAVLAAFWAWLTGRRRKEDREAMKESAERQERLAERQERLLEQIAKNTKGGD